MKAITSKDKANFLSSSELQLHQQEHLLPELDVDAGQMGGEAVVSADHHVLHVVLQLLDTLQLDLSPVGNVLQFFKLGT